MAINPTLFVPRSVENTSGTGTGSFLPDYYPPMWSDGERYGNDAHLKSFEALYRSQPVIAGVVDHIKLRTSTLPLDVFMPQSNGSRDRVPLENSLATLLRRPRPRMTKSHLVAHIMGSLLVHGNAVLAKLYADRDQPPIMLWPLNWSQLSAYGAYGEITAWETYQFNNERVQIDAKDTIHFAWPSPDGSSFGVSPLEKLGITLRTEDAAQRFQDANFRNGSRPSMALMLPENQGTNREAMALARAGVENLTRGVDRGGRMIVMSGGTKIETLSMSPVEVSLIEQRRLNREEVAIVYDLAGPSLNDATNASNGNVQERLRAFYRDIIPPWTTLIVETLEAQLIEPEPAWAGLIARFDFKDKLRGEPMEQAQTLKTHVEAGLMSRNEARIELGFPPEGDPNDPANPANQLTVNANNQNTLAALGPDAEDAP